MYITEPQGLDEVKSWLQKEQGNDFSVFDSYKLENHIVNQTSPTRAHIQFHPSKGDQLAQSEHGIVGDFVIRYDVVHPADGGNIQVGIGNKHEIVSEAADDKICGLIGELYHFCISDTCSLFAYLMHVP